MQALWNTMTHRPTQAELRRDCLESAVVFLTSSFAVEAILRYTDQYTAGTVYSLAVLGVVSIGSGYRCKQLILQLLN